MNQKIIESDNFIVHLLEILNQNKFKRVILFHGKKSFEHLDLKYQIKDKLKSFNVTFYNDFSSNPTQEEISKFEKLNIDQSDCFIAIGGGSVIDFCKIVYFGKKNILTNLKTLIAIPTTAGTGSESTQFATYYIDKIKNSIDDPHIRPSIVIRDASLLLTLPKEVKVNTLTDAFAQALESYWNIHSTTESEQIALEAMKLIDSVMVDYILNQNLQNSKIISRASNLAGQAINITRTTAAHAVSYPMTSFFGIEHGQAVGLTLFEFIKYNSNITEYNCNDPRGIELVKSKFNTLIKIFNVNTTDDLYSYLRNKFIKIGLKLKLKDFDITRDDLAVIIKHGFNPSRVKNNPKLLTEKDLNEILERIYE